MRNAEKHIFLPVGIRKGIWAAKLCTRTLVSFKKATGNLEKWLLKMHLFYW